MTAREEILARIRSALHTAPSDPVAAHARIAHTYNRVGSLDREARLHLFIDRLVDYDSEILQVASEAEIPGAIAEALQHADERRALIAPAFPSACLPEGFDFRIDNNLPTNEVEGVEAVVTTCEAAVASTGSIFLVHGGAQGRRVITLLPDHHICLVHRDQVFEVVPEALTAIAGNTTKPITTISGPSATSDIEMTRIRGVHGPRRLTVILYG
jgi:L-lactate dehydrogenase complex protein LldG